MFDDIKNHKFVRLITDRDDELLNKRKCKRATPKKNRLEIPKRIVEHEEAYEKLITLYNKLKTQILQEINQTEFSGKITSKSESPKKKINKKQVQEEVDNSEEEEIQEEVEEEEEQVQEDHDKVQEEEEEEMIDPNESDEEEDEESFEELETQDGRQFLMKENLIYSPEEKNEPFAEFTKVILRNDDTNAPFKRNDDYYIAGESIEIKSKNYILCKISDFVYDCDSLYKLGKIKKSRKTGAITGIKAC